MRRVILLTAYDGSDEHQSYLSDCLSDSLLRGEAPFAPFYPGVLDPRIAGENQLAELALRSWLTICDALVIYVDYGVSERMRQAMRRVEASEFHPTEVRSLREPPMGLPLEDPDFAEVEPPRL
jgi:hypothetical protein